MSVGLTFNVKTIVNGQEITERITRNITNIQGAFDAMILSDCNYFVPLKTGTLQRSGIIHSRIGSGLLIWSTPYARRMYCEYEPHEGQINPNACARWFDAAKARWLEKWVRFANDMYRRNS